MSNKDNKFMPENKKTAALIIIGNEILSGRTVDKNLNFLAVGLTEMGINMEEARVVKDIEGDIIKAVNELRAKCDYVFTSGGIGPTHDDITALSIAKAFGVELYRDPVAKKLLEDHYPPEKLNAARLKMADIPKGATLLNNPVSSAPGFKMENVFVMAGVPSIMQAMFEASKEHLEGGAKMLSRMISAYITEGNIAERLGDVQYKYPDVEIGSYPYIKNERLGTSLVVRSFDKTKLDQAFAEVKSILDKDGVEVEEEA